MDTRAPATNQKVADDLGITHSAVSRIRSGDRFPSVALMRNIETAYGWRLADQARLLGTQRYAIEFETWIAKNCVSL